jgi:WD40 repeat protein
VTSVSFKPEVTPMKLILL